MNQTKIKIGSEYTSDKVPKDIKFRRITTQGDNDVMFKDVQCNGVKQPNADSDTGVSELCLWHHTQGDNDVVFMFKDVQCNGVKQPNADSDTRVLELCLWHHTKERNPTQDTVDSVLSIQELNSIVGDTLLKEKTKASGIRPFWYGFENISEDNDDRLIHHDILRNTPIRENKFTSSCMFYPHIRTNRVPIVDNDGNIMNSKLLDNCRVNVLVRFSSVNYRANNSLRCGMDVVAVECINKKHNAVINHSTLLNKLKLSFETRFYDSFSKALQDCNAWLTGSYILQLIHDEQYDDSDVDVFCPSKRVSTMLECFIKNGGVVKDIYNAHTDSRGCEITKIPIENVIDIELGERKFQIISVLADDVEEHIMKNFDLDFCQVRWNGSELRPTDLTNIGKKVGKYNPCHTFHEERMKKYTNRGYKITVDFDAIAKSVISSTGQTDQITDVDKLTFEIQNM